MVFGGEVALGIVAGEFFEEGDVKDGARLHPLYYYKFITDYNHTLSNKKLRVYGYPLEEAWLLVWRYKNIRFPFRLSINDKRWVR